MNWMHLRAGGEQRIEQLPLAFHCRGSHFGNEPINSVICLDVLVSRNRHGSLLTVGTQSSR